MPSYICLHELWPLFMKIHHLKQVRSLIRKVLIRILWKMVTWFSTIMSFSSLIMVYIAACFLELLPFVYENSHFYHNFMKLVHNILYHYIFLEFDNVLYGSMPSWVIALCWWKIQNFYNVLSLNRVIMIRTVSNLFALLSTMMPFPRSNVVYIAIFFQELLPVVHVIMQLFANL